MEETQTNDLLDIAHMVLEDCKIEPNEVEMMRQSVLEDGAIDQEEAEILFAINDAIGEDGDCSCIEFNDFFVEMITAFLLSDELSDGRLDDAEWDWLKAMISEDDDLSSSEIKLLASIAEVSSSVPANFFEFTQQFEEVEYEDEDSSRMTFLSNYLNGVLKGKVREKE